MVYYVTAIIYTMVEPCIKKENITMELELARPSAPNNAILIQFNNIMFLLVLSPSIVVWDLQSGYLQRCVRVLKYSAEITPQCLVHLVCQTHDYVMVSL